MIKVSQKKLDPVLLSITLGLLVFGVLMVYDASVVYAHDVFGGKYHFLLRQLFWALLGSAGAAVVLFLDWKALRSLAMPLFFGSLLLLLFLAVPRFVSFPLYDRFAPEVNGARRWIVLNPPGVLPAVPLLSRISFQPSELAKFSLILYLAAWFSGNDRSRRKRSSLAANDNKKLPSFFAILFLLGLVGGLVLLEPDFATTAVIFAIGLWMYFIAGAPLLPLAGGSLAVMVAGVGFIFTSPYRRQRLLTFFDPSKADPLSAGYHLRQILIALGSGGLFGVGLGESRQKYGYLPESAGDSIFAIIGEELGFMGTVLLIFAFYILLWRAFQIVVKAEDGFYRYLAAGVTSWLALQILVNLCAMTGLIPLTGITLPLVSYGGSSMIFTMAGIGLLLKVSAES